MSKPDNPKPVIKFAVFHTFSTVKKGNKPFFFVFDNGDIGVGKPKVSFHKNTISFSYHVANSDVARIETTTTPAGKPETTIKIDDVHGRTDIFRVIQMISMSKGLVAAQLPPVLSTFFGDRYTKL